jgi:shikimate kinase
MRRKILPGVLEDAGETLLKNMNVVLIGYRGAGKSTVGSRLAIRMGKGFVDTDDLVEERQRASIRDIVESYGWDHFRAAEKRVIDEVSHSDDFIIAPGGGAVLDPENVASLKKNGLVIWLKADREALCRRIDRDSRTVGSRPALTGKGALEEFGEVMAIRNPFYERAADAQIDTTGMDLEEVVEALSAIIREKTGGLH